LFILVYLVKHLLNQLKLSLNHFSVWTNCQILITVIFMMFSFFLIDCGCYLLIMFHHLIYPFLHLNQLFFHFISDLFHNYLNDNYLWPKIHYYESIIILIFIFYLFLNPMDYIRNNYIFYIHLLVMILNVNFWEFNKGNFFLITKIILYNLYNIHFL